jgi:uncharacterized protein YlxW (UPF0749 family)
VPFIVIEVAFRTMSQEREENRAERITALESAVDGLTEELVDLESRVRMLEEELDDGDGTEDESESEETVEDLFEESDATPVEGSEEVIEDDIIIG